MKKIIAILLVISSLFLLSSCVAILSKEDEALLAAVQQDLDGSMFKAEFDNPYSTVDTVYIATFTEDTVTYKVTSVDSSYRRQSYTVESSYKLTMRDDEPYIIVDTHRFENLRVNLVSREIEEGDKIILSLKGDDPDVGHYYSRSY